MATAAARTASGSGRSRTRWRTVELMTAAVIGVTFGVAYWAYDAAYTPLSTALATLSGPALGLLGGPWMVAGRMQGSLNCLNLPRAFGNFTWARPSARGNGLTGMCRLSESGLWSSFWKKFSLNLASYGLEWARLFELPKAIHAIELLLR